MAVNGRLYIAEIDVIPSTLTNGTTYWAMRFVSGTGRVRIREMNVNVDFAAAAANSRSIFEVSRFSAATPTAGTSITANPVAGRTFIAPQLVTDIRQANGGLTTTSVTFEAPFGNPKGTSQPAAGVQLFLYRPAEEEEAAGLVSGDGICIRANGAVVSGIALQGHVLWEERAQ